MLIRSAKELEVHRKAYEVAMLIFGASKRFPPEIGHDVTLFRLERDGCAEGYETYTDEELSFRYLSKRPLTPLVLSPVYNLCPTKLAHSAAGFRRTPVRPDALATGSGNGIRVHHEALDDQLKK